MRYMSVCSGIECATVAWSPLGWTPVAFAEIDPFCCALLKYRYSEVQNHGDFTTITDSTLRALAPVDVLTAGTPCQSFSVAGLRAGVDDARGNLALEFIRLVHRLQPRWFLWENVPGVLSSGGGRDWATILRAVGECGYGYAWRILDAQHWGVPQRRRRVFLVGHIGGEWKRAAAVLFERGGLYGNTPPSRKKREAVAGTLGGGSGARGWCDDTDRATFIAELTTTHTLRADGFDASEGGTGRGTPLIPELAYALNAHTRIDGESETFIPVLGFTCKDSGQDVGDVSPTLRAMPHHHSHANAGGQVAVAFDERQVTSKDNRSNPQVGDPCHPLTQTPHAPLLSTGWVVRRLTVAETEALQGLPRGYTAVPYRGKPAADGPRYRAIGNGWAVPVVRWIGERIAYVDSIPASTEE